MKSFKELASSLQLEAKATYCGRCGTTHVPPSKGGTCPALNKEEVELDESVKIVDRDSDLDQEHFKLHVNGKPEHFVHHNYENSHASDSKADIHYQVKKQLKHLSPQHQKAVTNAVHASYRINEAQYGVNLGSRPVSGQKEYQGKEIKSFHPNKEKEAREYAAKNGYVVKKKMLPSGSNLTHTWDIHKEEAGLEESYQVVAKTKDGETFKSGVYDTKKKAHDMHWKIAKGNKHKSVEIVKVDEEIDLEEAVKIGSKVKIHAPGKAYHGEVGHVGEVRHGAYKGAPKTFTVDYGDNKSIQLDKKNVKLHNEEVEIEEAVERDPWKQKHFGPGVEIPAHHSVSVIVSHPDNPEKTEKRKVKLKAMGGKARAIEIAKDHMQKKGYKVHDANYINEEVELDEAVYSIKNTKTGQIYFHSKYPITKDNSRLKKIQSAGGDHIHATPHKDGKPMNEAYVAPALSAANFKAERDRQPKPESLHLDVKHVGGVSDPKAIKKHLASKGVHAQIGTSDGYKTVNMYNLSHKSAEFKRKLKEESDLDEARRTMAATGQYKDPETGLVVKTYPQDPKITKYKPKPTGGSQVYKSTIAKRFDKGSSVFAMKTSESVEHELQQGDPMSNMDQYVNAIGDKTDFRGGLEEQQKAHTVPKSEKEKDLAKLAPPHDKITHADVMVGRGVKKEEVDLDEEQIDELSINKMMTYRSKATEKLGSDPAKDEKRKEGIRVSGMKVKAKLKNEEVELDEAKDMMKVAGDIETYAKKSGGIDKADMMKVAGMIKRGDMKGAEKYTMRLDSDPRDFLLSKMGFNEAKEPPFDMPYKKAEPATKTDKSGAVHTPMSRARDLARQAMKKQMKEQFDLDITDEQADSLVESINLEEKTLTPAEMKKREEIAKAMERENPGMDMSKKMAIATATAKKVAEETELDEEQLDEISKATLGSYIKKAKGSAIGAAQVTGMGASMTGEKTQAKAERKVQKRAAGINKAVDRLTSEETDLEEGMISYTDFMDKIKMHRKAGNKIVDDKYSDKHATYTSVDSEGTAKKITHTPAGVKQQHMGNMKADDDQAAEAKPAEKRSRGRPAGSKSGVSKYNK